MCHDMTGLAIMAGRLGAKTFCSPLEPEQQLGKRVPKRLVHGNLWDNFEYSVVGFAIGASHSFGTQNGRSF